MKKSVKKILTAVMTAYISFSGVLAQSTGTPVFITAIAEDVPADNNQNAMMVILLMMLSSGMRLTGSFNDQIQAVQNAYTSYTAENSNAPSVSDINAGSSIYGGSLRLTDSVNNGIQDFINAYAEDKGLSVGASQTFTDSVSGGGVNYVRVPTGSTKVQITGTDAYWCTSGTDVRTVMFGTSTTGRYNTLYFVSKESGVTVSYPWSGGGTYTTLNLNRTVDGTTYHVRQWSGVYETYSVALANAYYTAYGSIDIGTATNNEYTAIAYTFGAEAGLPDRVLQGDTLELKDGIMIGSTQAKLIDLTYLQEYAASLAGSAAQEVESIADLEGVITGALDTAEAQTGAQALPFDTVNESTTSQVIPADQAQTSNADVSQYKTTGLQSVFPFSIPWDIYYFIKMFNATPEPIVYTIPFVVTGIIDSSYTIDLTAWGVVAQVIRTAVLLSWILWLIVKTRDWIRA